MVPMHNIADDVKVVMHGPDQPKHFGNISLNIKIQPNYFVSACHMTKRWFLFDEEECFEEVVERKSNQVDGSVVLNLYGMFYEQPAGELYAWFETKNSDTYAHTCTFDVYSGNKWFG